MKWKCTRRMWLAGLAGLFVLPFRRLRRKPGIYVNSETGSDSNDGRSWASPIRTLSEVRKRVEVNDLVYLRGCFVIEGNNCGIRVPAGCTIINADYVPETYLDE